MKVQHLFVRTLVVLLSVLFSTLYFHEMWWMGALAGLGFGALLIGIDLLFKKFNLRLFNLGVLGLFLGYLLGLGLQLVFRAVVEVAAVPLPEPLLGVVQIAIYLFALYLGVMMTLRAADQLHLSIPFVRLDRKGGNQARSLLLHASVLTDERLLGVAKTGLLDGRLILPRFVKQELRSKEALEQVRKLKDLPGLGLRIQETDFVELSEGPDKLLSLAQLVGADLLTAEAGVGGAHGEVRLINLHTLSKALKPIEQSGDCFELKIQQQGKEGHQGIGYLDNGTMVVVNGGSDYIGEEISCRILAVKHTAVGRMIFCNVAEE